jgi:hypothetical protein
MDEQNQCQVGGFGTFSSPDSLEAVQIALRFISIPGKVINSINNI